MIQNENLDIWKQRCQEINTLLPEATEFLAKSGVDEDSEFSALVVAALWADANEKDYLIFTALNDIQKLYESPMIFNEIDTVRGVEPVIVGDVIFNSFYCLWVLEWGETQGISVKLSTNSSGYSPVMSIKGRSNKDEVPVIPSDDEQKFLKCLGDCFLFETKAIL